MPIYPSHGLRSADLRQWAKEVVLDALDAGIVDALAQGEHSGDIMPNDKHAVLTQRDRVAKFLGLPLTAPNNGEGR